MVMDEYAGDLTKGGRCDGSEEKPFEMSCIEDLVAFSQNVNTGNNYSGKYIKLMRTLDFNSIFSYNDYTTKEYGDLNENGKTENIKVELTKTDIECIGFSPIGSNRNRYFGGTLDGQGYEINNIYENSTTFAGLFGYAYGGFKIMNLGISGNINSQDGSAGGILGAKWAEGTSNIINCYNIGEISGTSKYNIANANLIDNCYYKATTYIGGDSSSTISFSNIKTENIAQRLNDYITENSKDGIWNYWGYDEMDNLVLIKE